MEYIAYLPDIDIEAGKSLVLDNAQLYTRFLYKFDGAKMVNNISDAFDAGDIKGAVDAAHALKGTAANLGFLSVQGIAGKIESLGKNGKDFKHLIHELNDAMASLAEAIGRFVTVLEE
jgi:HPt (histidine-containing phosphotransfer) domain-containing protein